MAFDISPDLLTMGVSAAAGFYMKHKAEERKERHAEHTRASDEFLLPLIALRDKKLFTIGVGLIYLDGEYVKQWGQIMAAYFTAAIPLILLFLFTMRLFVRGLSQGAIKG